ncbi:MAG: hypothetical protein COV57_01645 [Candidatus Liptonbacteria bacterium CG11_big_fil_rev_8_21_14_0_20_35_14]|uniref:Uncharacterized protein n=1 Tax=Candidatus Liptonbacteria bacterium CG11_big_fil_rev_8_21_14_0_20_35_14 TaxID=1974634 RepID=A0A2H0NA31_9BACT|nr:MAG: hypothetical protein COV57_01645 [Candidatus Liptonbacteria bacterium CG11_big_fil_rev_8_21_14_0_20_35_14]
MNLKDNKYTTPAIVAFSSFIIFLGLFSNISPLKQLGQALNTQDSYTISTIKIRNGGESTPITINGLKVSTFFEEFSPLMDNIISKKPSNFFSKETNTTGTLSFNEFILLNPGQETSIKLEVPLYLMPEEYDEFNITGVVYSTPSQNNLLANADISIPIIGVGVYIENENENEKEKVGEFNEFSDKRSSKGFDVDGRGDKLFPFPPSYNSESVKKILAYNSSLVKNLQKKPGIDTNNQLITYIPTEGNWDTVINNARFANFTMEFYESLIQDSNTSEFIEKKIIYLPKKVEINNKEFRRLSRLESNSSGDFYYLFDELTMLINRRNISEFAINEGYNLIHPDRAFSLKCESGRDPEKGGAYDDVFGYIPNDNNGCKDDIKIQYENVLKAINNRIDNLIFNLYRINLIDESGLSDFHIEQRKKRSQYDQMIKDNNL